MPKNGPEKRSERKQTSRGGARRSTSCDAVTINDQRTLPLTLMLYPRCFPRHKRVQIGANGFHGEAHNHRVIDIPENGYRVRDDVEG
jgi:hypothetical protein